MRLALGEGTCERLSLCLRGAVCQPPPWGKHCPTDSLDPGWSSGHSGSTPAHTLGVDTARSGVTHNLHGRSSTWFEPMSAAGFASVGLSWFCFAAVIVFNSNAAQHKEVVASFLFSRHQGWLSKATIHLAPIRLSIVKTAFPALQVPSCSSTDPCPMAPHSKTSLCPRGREQLFSHPLLDFSHLLSKAILPQPLTSALWTTKSSNSINLTGVKCGPTAPLLLS